MSKWGRVSKSDAEYKFDHQPEEAFEMVAEMATAVIAKDDEIRDLKNDIQTLQMEIIGKSGTIANLSAIAGRLEGYRDRVREVDGMEEVEE